MANLNWTNVLKIRAEAIATDGGIGDLQMSLHRAVYQTTSVPYQDVAYYGDITEPTPNLVGFFSRVARRLSGDRESVALYYLDQGMGGGKSHALVGLYHMANSPQPFFNTHIGQDVKREAETGIEKVGFADVRIVTLTADHFSPGKATETFGPALNLFERFLWSLFRGDQTKYKAAIAQGANKATLQAALASVGGPVLVLLDELMDYAMALSDVSAIGTMPSEQAFLNALMDACDDVPRVAFVLVMIKTELDREGYTPAAQEFREYLANRITRNGDTIAVTETGDFSAIIRRRIFEQNEFKHAAISVAESLRKAVAADSAWQKQVFARLGNGNTVAVLHERIQETYPFHPDLMDLVQNEWAKTQGFQRVRSTVAIFALTALHWSSVSTDGGFVPDLIGVGDLPLGGIRNRAKMGQARCLEALLNSGLLLGNDRAIQGFRSVATTDISSADGKNGRAVEIDRALHDTKVIVGQPNPAVRMATALFNYSLVSRSQGKRGATKAELMAAVFLASAGSNSTFSSVEEVFTAITSDTGLGALETTAAAQSHSSRFLLTIKQTLRMFFHSAKNQIDDNQAHDLAWTAAKNIAFKGPFAKTFFVERPASQQSLSEVAGGLDSEENRLLILDLRKWTLLNGVDSISRDDIRKIFGVGPDCLVVDSPASCVISCVNTQQRQYAYKAAHEVLAWTLVSQQIIDADEQKTVAEELSRSRAALNEYLRKAYRHFCYLTRNGDKLEVSFGRFDEDKQTALNGSDVWSALVAANRAVGPYFDSATKLQKKKQISEVYLSMLLNDFDRHLTLRDVVASFYRNPRFPLIPSLDEIREAVFSLIQPPGHAGANTGGWELVGSDGLSLQVETAKQLGINSAQTQIRPYQPIAGPDHHPRLDLNDNTDLTQEDGECENNTKPYSQMPSWPETVSEPSGVGSELVKKTQSYSWYSLDLSNRSIADETIRQEIRSHLLWLAGKLDNETLDHQLFSLSYRLMAATNSALTDDVEVRGKTLDAKAQVRLEDI